MKRNNSHRHRLLVGAVIAGGLGMVSIAHTLGTAHANVPLSQSTSAEELSSSMSVQTDRVIAEGHVVTYPGAQVTLSAETSGRILKLEVQEGQKVHQGDLVAQISCDDTRAALDEAVAQKAEAEADIRYFETRTKIVNQMANVQAASALEMLDCRHGLEDSQAHRQRAVATIDRLQAELAKAKIVSPIDGTITARSADPGQVAELETPIVSVADLDRTRIEAEVNEFDVGQVHVGSMAIVTAEGYPGRQWRAKVQEIPDQVVSRHLRPQDPGRPTDTGVLLVKLVLLDAAPLKLGQRVEVRIDPLPAAH